MLVTKVKVKEKLKDKNFFLNSIGINSPDIYNITNGKKDKEKVGTNRPIASRTKNSSSSFICFSFALGSLNPHRRNISSTTIVL